MDEIRNAAISRTASRLRSVFIVERSANSAAFHCLWVSGTPGFCVFFLFNFWLANTFQMSRIIIHIMWSRRRDSWHLSGTRVTRFGPITYTPPGRSYFRFSRQLLRLFIAHSLYGCLSSVSCWIFFCLSRLTVNCSLRNCIVN